MKKPPVPRGYRLVYFGRLHYGDRVCPDYKWYPPLQRGKDDHLIENLRVRSYCEGSVARPIRAAGRGGKS